MLGKIMGQAKQVQFVVVLGDITNRGSEGEWKEIRDFLERSGVKFHLIRGDNDRIDDPQGSNFSKYFGPLYYSFDYENSHFLFLDNSDGYNGAWRMSS